MKSSDAAARLGREMSGSKDDDDPGSRRSGFNRSLDEAVAACVRHALNIS